MGGFYIPNEEQLEWSARTALRALVTQLNAWTGVDHRPDGTHGEIRATSVETRALTETPDGTIPEVASQAGTLREAGGHRWLRGPWLFDENGANSNMNVAALRPAQITANTNNYHPEGVDTAAIVEMSSDAARNLTGVQIAARQKRLLVLGNAGSYTITLTHESSSSGAANRFDLPDDQDLALPPGLYVWLYYEVSAQRWRAFAGSPGLKGGAVQSASLDLTAAQFNSLNTSPQTIVAAPGAGLFLNLHTYHFEQNLGGTTFSGTPNVTIRYSGMTDNLTGNFTLANAANRKQHGQAGLTTFSTLSGVDISAANRALVVCASADTTSGSGSFRATVTYSVGSALY